MPVIVAPFLVEYSPFADSVRLPRNGKPAGTDDGQWAAITSEVMAILKKMG